MPDFNPKEMDALFREGADRLEFEYNPDAWALMEKKLDAKAKRRRIFFILLGLLFFIGSLAIYKSLDHNNEKVQPLVNTSETLDSRTEEIKGTITPPEQVDSYKGNPAILNQTKPQTTNESISADSKESSINIGAQNSFQSENTGNLMGHEIVSIDSQTRKSTKDEELLQNNSETEENALIAIEKDKSKSLTTNKLIHVTDLHKNDLSPLSFIRKKVELKDFPSVPAIQENQISPISNRWTLALFANPEWSSVGLFKESKTGWSFGTKIGYQFADKFEISGGIAYSRKIYKGGGEAYTMSGGWFDNIEPMRMDAKCDVIEIPIGLSYHLNGFRNNGFFVDLGINSYMLHSEWYGFEYNDALIRPNRYNEVIEEDQNSHLIGVGRIAIGYQKVLSKSASFQIAPYLQLPLTGIGAGQVNVYSSGVQVAVKFNTK